ncbi:MAG TPA: NYN domain-containing protein [Gemmatimonadaceae bacterium]|nr:NYN domain-containing protein [Gemmatimonadaceae bacterium]
MPAAMVGSAFHHAPNAALLIDFDNVTMGIQKDLQQELRNLLSSDIIKGKVAVQRAYADWRRYPQYIVPLSESSIDLIFAPAYGSSKKNATDIRLAIDAMELVFTRPEIGTIILLSGDSDFSTLVIKLKEYGKYVIGVGIRESASDLLVMNCDEYYSYNALAGLVRSGDEEHKKYDPWELVSEAIARMKRNGDVMRADRLKQVMQDIDSSFDEKNLGMAKFSRFVQEAAHRGLVTVTKLENGQFEVSPPAAAAAATAVAPAEGAAPRLSENGEERPPRRDRDRGRRGRGRDRERDESRGTPAAGAPVVPQHTGEFAVPTLVEGGDADMEAPREESAPAAADTVTVRHERAPRHDRGERAGRGGPRPHATPSRVEIGVSGERLTRQEAFDLVRRAVEAVVTGDESASAQRVREQAFTLLARDSESLSERNFARILRDAHDADVIDLRRRGDDYEVALAVQAAPVSDQLNQAAAANAPAPVSAPAVPRGMGPRGVTAGLVRTRGLGGRGAAGGLVPPPELLSIGVVDVEPATVSAAPAAAAPEITAPAPMEAPAPSPRSASKRGAVAQATVVAAAAPAAEESAGDDEIVAPRTAAKRSRGTRGGRGGGAARAGRAPAGGRGGAATTEPVVMAAEPPAAASAPAIGRGSDEAPVSEPGDETATATRKPRRPRAKKTAGARRASE